MLSIQPVEADAGFFAAVARDHPAGAKIPLSNQKLYPIRDAKMAGEIIGSRWACSLFISGHGG